MERAPEKTRSRAKGSKSLRGGWIRASARRKIVQKGEGEGEWGQRDREHRGECKKSRDPGRRRGEPEERGATGAGSESSTEQGEQGARGAETK